MSLKTLEEVKARPYSSSLVPLLERAQADRAWQGGLDFIQGILTGRSLLKILVLAAAVGGAAYVARGSTSAPTTSGIPAAKPLRSVKVERPTQASRSNVVLPATFQPWQSTTLHARVSGYLTAWHRELGSPVKAGELLAEIETPELDQELAEGESLASEARAAVVQSQAQRSEAAAELRVAEAQLERARVQTTLARTQLARREKLLTTRAVSQEDYDTFQTEVEARSADVAAAEADVARRKVSLETHAAMIAAREATARSRQANVERLRELLVFKKIVAPFDGVVTRRSAEVGMLVTAGKESLYVIEDTSRIRVQLNVPQTYAAQTRRGVSALVTLPESNLPAVAGEITRTSESVDPVNRTMLAEIELDNASHKFQPGSYAQVTLSTSQSGTQWTVPTNTISMRVEGPHVAFVNEHDEIELKPVRLGRDLGSRVVVAEGIGGAERLVVNPSDDLRSGMQVQVGGRTGNAQEIAKR